MMALLPPATLLAAAAIPDVVHRAAVSWPDADWPAEMGSMPLGNGDVSGQAWVCRESGELLVYLAKSDVRAASSHTSHPCANRLCCVREWRLPKLRSAAGPVHRRSRH
jgi:hypothetical protein